MRWRRRPDAIAQPVTIVDLAERHEPSYFVCLEDWSAEMQEAGDHKARWYDQHRDRGLRVKLAVDDRDQAVGMIQYVPIELSPAQGEDLYMILCVWVHGHGEGVGDAQGHGVGTALLDSAEADARQLGAKGMVAWGLHLPVWMKSSWFKKHGYRQADRSGMADLVWKPFTDDAVEPQWVPEKPVPEGESGKVNVIAYNSGWCPAANLVYERARRASEDLGTDVHFRTIDTSDRETLLATGHDGEVFVDGRRLQRGAPPSYRAVRRRIEKRLRRLRKRQHARPRDPGA
ncbi:MAG: GNAT family N-acetyltransferase [Acidimicrobiia bacterium]|nr:GNAT family N-acetyltransferase [Acidimicrobiia bacterium]